MLRVLYVGPALAVALLLLLGTTANPARFFNQRNRIIDTPWSELSYLPDTGVRWTRHAPDFVFPSDEGDRSERYVGPLRLPTNGPQSSENNLPNDNLAKDKNTQDQWAQKPSEQSERSWTWTTQETTVSPTTLSTDETRPEVPCSNEATSSPTTDFGYSETNGPHTWPTVFSPCGGIRQSPIDITLQNSIQPPDDVDPAVFLKYYDAPPLHLTLVNSGHSVHLTGNWSTRRRPTVSGPVLNGEYALEEVHFHWGEDEDEGSEHFVNGESYPLEMHIVHYKKSYGSIGEAKKQDDGLAVVSYLFKIQEERNLGLQKIIESTKHILDPKTLPIPITPFSLDKLAPSFTRNYVSYLGSLTTPPCSEIVTWVVNLKPLGVSVDQLLKLHKLKSKDGKRLIKNSRPLQNLNGRVIKYIS